MSVSEPIVTKFEEAKKTTFDVLFVGLTCFVQSKRVALMPDGRTPPRDQAGKEVASHFPYIVVDPAAIRDAKGWETDDQQLLDFMERGIYRLPKCRVEINPANTPGDLDTTQHDTNAPKLFQAGDRNGGVDPGKANAVVRFQVGRGVLETRRSPNSLQTDADVAMVSRLRVEHDGPVVVEVYGEGEKDPRFLSLDPHTNVAVANISFPADNTKLGSHFSIYGQLTTSRTIGTAVPMAPAVPRIESPDDYQIFRLALPFNDGSASCGVQTCCPGG
jgi:hypothetical protein